MTARKSGIDIYVEGTGNTLASVTSDINDTTWIEKIGSDPDVYEVKVAVRYFMVRPDAEFTIGDSGDYSKNETLQFTSSTASRHSFWLYYGATFNMYGDTTLNMSTDAIPAYIYIWGSVNCLGNDTYQPTWTRIRRIYLYEQTNADTYNDVWHFEKMKFWNFTETNSYPMFYNGVGKVRNHIFKDVTYGNDSNDWGYVIYIPYATNGYENITFENITFEHTRYAIYNLYGAAIHLKNCTFGYTYTTKNFFRGNSCSPYSDTVRNYADNGRRLGQSFSYLEGCTWENKANTIGLNIGGCAVCLFKDCEWQGTSGDLIDVLYQGRVLMWTGNTFTGGERWDVDTDGAIQWVYGLDLTINDNNGSPVEDAIVFIKQKDGKEYCSFRTKSDGKLENIHDLEVALLTNKHQYGNNATTDAEYWSDDSNSTYHDVWVLKEGFKPYHTTYVMDQDRTDTLTLELIAIPQSNLIETTISETNLNASVTQTDISTDITEEM